METQEEILMKAVGARPIFPLACGYFPLSLWLELPGKNHYIGKMALQGDLSCGMALERFSVILVRPENPENIGLVARSMKNTGFSDLRFVGRKPLSEKSFVTAVHSGEVLEKARFYSHLRDATADLHAVFSATAKKRKQFTLLTLDEALEKMLAFSHETRIGLLFGNERTGLVSEELFCTNFLFSLPQASRQPSYNLASAVLLTLFSLFNTSQPSIHDSGFQEKPLPRSEQEECLHIILDKLEQKGFIYSTNKKNMTAMMHDLFGRIAMTPQDRRLLLALFSKGIQREE